MDTPGIAVDRRSKNWFRASNYIWTTPVSKHAKLVYLYLCRCAEDKGQCFPSLTDIERKTGLGHESVTRALNELEGLEFDAEVQAWMPVDGAPILIRRKRNYAHVNIYEVFDPPAPQAQVTGVRVPEAANAL